MAAKSPDAATSAALGRIDDLARLEDCCRRLPAAGSWQELLGSRRRRR